MKKLLVIFLLLFTFKGFGQSVSAPDPKSFVRSTTAQDASGFVLSGFNSTQTLLCAIGLPQAPASTTFYLTSTSGLTPASGFTMSGNKTRLVFTGTMANINNALATLKVNTPSATGNIQLSVSATVNPAGYFYNPNNGHFYRPITSGTTYTNARSLSLQQTFKGQQGYLVTITSADEDAFIFNNVPQSNIWFALTDEVSEGRWVIDAGPEMGTLIKTSNGQFAGNIVGQYNNWAGGEPNNWGGNEDYAVTKWNGSQWNDLGNTHWNPYVVEFGTWTNPDDQTFTDFYSNSVIHSNGDVLRAQFNFEFGNSITKTNFNTKLLAQSNNQYLPTTNVVRNLNGLGKIDMTSDLDTIRVSSGGMKALTTTGQVEWCVIYEYETQNQRYRIGIDSREVNGIVSNPSSINNLQLFDLWNGPVTFNSYDPNGWTEVYVYTDVPFNFGSSDYSDYLRSAGWGYGVRAEFTFTPISAYKPHGIQLNTTNVTSLYNNIVTVSDVFLAFKELSNRGLFGNESGNEFSSGVQYMNADIDGNGMFDERDTYKLIQHLVGEEIIGNGSNNLSDYIKILPKSEYDLITKQNWNTKPNITSNTYSPISISSTTLLNSFNYNVFWKGDVNMSHSAQQTLVSSRTNSGIPIIGAEMWTEVKDDNVYWYINVNPKSNEVSGVQFQLNYDNTKLQFDSVEFKTSGNPTNFGSNRGSFVNVGSIINNGIGLLDDKTQYVVKFKTKSSIKNSLGLISIGQTDAVSKDGIQLKVEVN